MARNSTMPKSVMFCWVLSNSTQNGSAPGSGKSTPVPTFWFWQRNGLLPSHGTTGAAAPAGAAKQRAPSSASARARRPIPRAGISPAGQPTKPRTRAAVSGRGLLVGLVLARAAAQTVLARPAGELVVAAAAFELVGPCATREGVLAVAAGEAVLAAAAG